MIEAEKRIYVFYEGPVLSRVCPLREILLNKPESLSDISFVES
jgi:hypothetical protein